MHVQLFGKLLNKITPKELCFIFNTDNYSENDYKIFTQKFLKCNDEKYSITCGIFGLEHIMDDVARGLSADIAISKFIHGIAFNAWNFAKNPEKICISGGFCDNKCFIESLKKYCDVVSLGRFVLVDGLAEY